ncbi:putative receptor like protein 25 [Syzygium oleosum]|uniref:putative receptor like protein 25 n=1 Tax=Syzygium oleosum TaxID=219896 RepID=UPI0024B929FD|nr:putative receptor like protein 25 [Syzygium oleosum]
MMNGQNGQESQDKSLYMRHAYGIMDYYDSVNVIVKGKEILLLSSLTIFTTFDLSLNSFEGNIPDVIGHLHSLIGLNLSHNHLTGSIPPTLGNLTNLEWLDLSSNKLSGRIPRELGDLAFLGYLNLSENQLTGRIPQDKQLSTFTSDSFRGNLGLYGTSLQNTSHDDAQSPPSAPSFLQEDSTKEYASWFEWKAVGIGYASGMVIGISISYISWETRRPKWLARKVRRMERRGAKWMKKPKWKAIKFHGG